MRYPERTDNSPLMTDVEEEFDAASNFVPSSQSFVWRGNDRCEPHCFLLGVSKGIDPQTLYDGLPSERFAPMSPAGPWQTAPITAPWS